MERCRNFHQNLMYKFQFYLRKFQKHKSYNLFFLWYTRTLNAIVWTLAIYAVSIPLPTTLQQSTNSTNTSNQYISCLNTRIPLIQYYNISRDVYLSLTQNNNSFSDFSLSITNSTKTIILCQQEAKSVEINVFRDISDNQFSLVILALLVAFSALLGYITSLILLPPLFGMVIAGVLFSLISRTQIGSSVIVPMSVLQVCRGAAVVVILGGFGLRLSHKILKTRFFEVIGLALIPSFVEIALVSLFAGFILQVPWEWACMSGSIVAAVAPTIVVPVLLKLKNQGYCVGNGLPDILISASYFQIIFILLILFTFRAIGISTSGLGLTILRGPMEFTIGIIYGSIFGVLSYFVGLGRKDDSRTRNRTIYYLGVALFSIYISPKIIIFGSDIAGAGVSGVITTSIVCSMAWGGQKKSVTESLKYIKLIVEPLIFGLLGYDLFLTRNGILFLTALEITGIIMVGIMFRSVVAFLVTFCFANLKIKDKLFVPIVWTSRGTLQAIAGSLALYSAHTPELMEYGKIVLFFAILSTILTFPLGYFPNSLFGTRMLTKESHTQGEDNNQANKETSTSNHADNQLDNISNAPPGDIFPVPPQGEEIDMTERVKITGIAEDARDLTEDKYGSTERLCDVDVSAEANL